MTIYLCNLLVGFESLMFVDIIWRQRGFDAVRLNEPAKFCLYDTAATT